MASKITNEDIIRMNDLYLQYHTYAEVARQTGFSPSTVRKYIQKDWVPLNDRPRIIFDPNNLPDEPDLSIFNGVENFGDLCVLSPEEEAEIQILWEELTT